MTTKSFVYLGLFMGSVIGGYIPSLFGDTSLLSYSAFWGSTIGAFVGIFVGYKIGMAYGV